MVAAKKNAPKLLIRKLKVKRDEGMEPTVL